MKDSSPSEYDVIIAGGGLASLVSGIILVRNGFSVLILEKKKYPFHKVCGEYVSNEVLTILLSLGFDPFALGASEISRLRLSDVRGNCLTANLDLGGFGLSRYTMDYELSKIARSYGVEIIEDSRVNNIEFNDNFFNVFSTTGNYTSNFVIGAYGKRDVLDRRIGRKFMDRHTGYMGVKYHIKSEYPPDEIGLYHFRGGYCGISKIEGEKYNLCYLYKRSSGKKISEIGQLEEQVLFRNPALKSIFYSAQFILDAPEVINEISFDAKDCVNNHILFCGDSAGLITPLCGNGMAMAIHGAVILTSFIMSATPGECITTELRNRIEKDFSYQWREEFSERLFWGRQLQRLSGRQVLTTAALKFMKIIPPLKDLVIKKTHGKSLQAFNLQSVRQSHQIFHR